jgi:hypothetical protein
MHHLKTEINRCFQNLDYQFKRLTNPKFEFLELKALFLVKL